MRKIGVDDFILSAYSLIKIKIQYGFRKSVEIGNKGKP